MTQSTAELTDLSKQLEGELVTPGDDRYDEARAAWNLIVDQHPAAVVYAASAADVGAVVRYAARAGLEVAPQGTGHGAATRGDIGSAILLRTERINSIEIDPERRVARLGAGVIWRDALAAAGEHGLAGPAGSSPDVGVAGYVTGGGFGWLSRAHGLACSHVLGFDVVTADGEQRRVDADSEPDLFWALRGGGGDYAVITAVDVALLELSEVFAGSVILPADERSGEIMAAYREWAAQVPDEVTSIARFLNLPPLDEIPEMLRARPLITLGACYAGPAGRGEELIAPLRRLAEPVMDTFGPMSPAQLVTVHMDPEHPVPGLVHHQVLREFPAEALERFVELAGPDSGSPLLGAEVRHAGGKLAEPAEGGGALSQLEAEFVFEGVGAPMTPELGAAIHQRLDEICAALEPWSTGRPYPNFVERPTPAEQIYPAETLTRLREIKQRFDPDGLIRANRGL